MQLKNYENIVSDVKACLDMHNWSYSDAGVRATVDRWLEAKGGVIDILRKHPNWNEDAMAVVFDYDTMREIDRQKYMRARESLYQKYLRLISDLDYNERCRLRDRMGCITDPYIVCHQFVHPEIAKHFADYGIQANKGTKVSRVLGKYFRSIGLDKVDGYNHDYAELADALNPLKITRFSLLSVHPCDYLHMSYGTGWQSCHNIDGGEYMAGTLSYMGDKGSMIFYTVDKGYSGEARYFWREAKINRQVYSYAENMLLQSRLYPNCDDIENYTNFRNAVQKVMADALGVPNYWSIVSTWDKMSECGLSTHQNGLHYEDYYYDEYRANLSILKGTSHGELIVGSTAYCIDCGKQLDENHRLNCCGRWRCTQCGEYVNDYECVFIDDKPYCPECVERCQICGEYHVKGTLVEVESHRGVHRVCNSCAESYCIRCAVCGKLVHNAPENIKHYGDEPICTSCVVDIVVAARAAIAKEAANEVA